MPHKLKRYYGTINDGDVGSTHVYLADEADAVIADYAAFKQQLKEIATRLRHSTKCNIHAACYGPIEPCDCGLQDLRSILNKGER